MIDRKELAAFTSSALAGGPWVSVYLDVMGVNPATRAYRIKAKELLKDVGKGGNGGVSDAAARLLGLVEDGLDRKGARSICAFCAPAAEPFLFRLPVAVHDRAGAGPSPMLHPFLPMVQTARDLLIVVAGRGKATFFGAFMGRLAEGESLTEEIPSKVREGGWQGYSEKKIDRHVEDHLRHFLHRLAETTAAKVRSGNPDYLVLVGPKEIGAALAEEVGRALPEGKIIVRVAGAEPTWEGMVSLVKEVEELIRRREEDALLECLGAQLPVHRAVSGVTASLRALSSGQVDTLLVAGVAPLAGTRCPSCGALDTEAACPFCHLPAAPVEDLMDQVSLKVLDQGCRLFLAGGDELPGRERLSALLRFPV